MTDSTENAASVAERRRRRKREEYARNRQDPEWVDRERARLRDYMRKNGKQIRRKRLADDPQYFNRCHSKWREENREIYLERAREQSKKRREYRKAFMARPEQAAKQRARMKLYTEVRAGRIVKPDACSACGARPGSKRIHGHHEDYGRPLDVVWLCTQCHGKHFKRQHAA